MIVNGEIALRWFGHIERMGNGWLANKVYVGDCVGSRLLSRSLKRWIDPVNDCLKKSGLNVGRARNMVYERNEWQKFVRGSA